MDHDAAMARGMAFRSWRWYLVAAGAVALVLAGASLPIADWARALYDWIHGFGLTGCLVYAAVFTVWSLVLPPFLLQVLAGFLYGFWIGMAIVFTGSTCAILFGYWLARRYGRAHLQRALERHRMLRAVDAAVAREGWRAVFLVRLSACIPSNLANFVFGLTALPLRTIIVAGWAGKLPGVALSVWIGVTGGQAFIATGEIGLGPWTWVMLALAVLAMAWMGAVMTRRTREMLARDAAAAVEL